MPRHPKSIQKFTFSISRTKSDDVTLVTAPYAIDVEGLIYDAATYRGPAAYANDARDKKRNNSKLMGHEDGTIHMYAIKNIRTNAEIFTDYGEEYWMGASLPHETKRVSQE